MLVRVLIRLDLGLATVALKSAYLASLLLVCLLLILLSRCLTLTLCVGPLLNIVCLTSEVTRLAWNCSSDHGISSFRVKNLSWSSLSLSSTFKYIFRYFLLLASTYLHSHIENINTLSKTICLK